MGQWAAGPGLGPACWQAFRSGLGLRSVFLLFTLLAMLMRLVMAVLGWGRQGTRTGFGVGAGVRIRAVAGVGQGARQAYKGPIIRANRRSQARATEWTIGRIVVGRGLTVDLGRCLDLGAVFVLDLAADFSWVLLCSFLVVISSMSHPLNRH